MAKQPAPVCDRTRGRRNRRAANDSLLASAAPDLDSQALVELFAYTSASFWDSWQAFAALPEHIQAHAAAIAAAAKSAGADTRAQRARTQSRTATAQESMAANASSCNSSSSTISIASGNDESLLEPLRRIDLPIRSLLVQGHVEPLLRKIEDDVVRLDAQQKAELKLVLPSARDRMVAHGVAQFYGLSHRSLDMPDMRRVTVIRADASKRNRPRPSVRLADLVCASS